MTATSTAKLREPREVMREEPLMHAPILAALQDGPATIPEIAARIGAPTHEVVYWVMGMRRFGLLAESTEADDDGYFAYGPLPTSHPAGSEEGGRTSVDTTGVDESCLTVETDGTGEES